MRNCYSSKMAMLKLFFGMIIVRCASTAVAHNFDFEVISVTQCPMSKKDWESASIRLKCNRTHGYHCVPDKYFSSLIEFCYPHGYRLPFEKGNCLELAANGILNHVPCHNTFSNGCPTQFYFSNEIYKYPKCLSINTELRCFDADVPCIVEKINKDNSANHNISTVCQVNSTVLDKTTSCNTNCATAYIVTITIFLSIIVGISVTLTHLVLRRRRTRGVSSEAVPMSITVSNDDDTSEAVLMLKTEISDDDTSEAVPMSKTEISDDEEFSCLVDACRNGDYKKYQSLMPSDKVRETDWKGQNLLHHAVHGGNYDILHDLLKYELDMTGKDYIGRTVLHIAAKKGNTKIFKAVLQSLPNNEMLNEDDKNGLKPFCYAALAGQVEIIDIIKGTGFDIAKQTKYGETIAHLACIGDSLDVLKMASTFNDKRNQEYSKTDNEEDGEIIKKKNKMDWNPLQYAAKTGNTALLNFLFEKNVMVINPTEDLKYAFHSACENGRLDACRFIFTKCPDSIHDKDKEGRNACHFAAKSGNVEVLKFLIDVCKLKADLMSSQNVNILHIACRHGRFEMCVYIAKMYPGLVKKESKKGWNAALFLSERGGATEERIRILTHLVQKHDLFVYHVSRAGKSVLYNACANRSYKLCKHLLENYTELLTIERSMDLKNGASDTKINRLLDEYLKKISR